MSNNLVNSVPEGYREHAAELCEQLEFMRLKLIEARQNMADMPTVIAYDNGGGQRGIRKNPAFDAYSQLMRTYTRTLAELRELAGNGATRQPELVKFQKFAETMKKAAD